MQLETNYNRERIDYGQQYLSNLDESEEAVCEPAVQEVEEAIAQIVRLQEQRKNDDGTIDNALQLDQLRKLERMIEELDDNLAILKLAKKADDWSRKTEERRKVLKEAFLNEEVQNE